LNNETQCKKILNYLEHNKTITVREAFYLGINSPTRRITDLRRKGYSFKEEWKYLSNSRYKVYSLGV